MCAIQHVVREFRGRGGGGKDISQAAGVAQFFTGR
jgi:hypothetical protein